MKNEKISNEPLKLSVVTDNSQCCKTVFDKVFDKPCFLELLRVERHRAQRSKSALSMVVIMLDSAKTDSPADISGVLKTVHVQIRETDMVGYIDQHTLGVLLPYTDKKGATIIAEKIQATHKNSEFVVSAATYPDQVFESFAKQECVSVDTLKLMLEDSIEHSWFKPLFKRAIDIIGSIIILLVLSPAMLMTALLIKMDSPGPVIFRQTRLGKKGAPFTFYKFRSMRTDTNDQIHRDFVLKLIDGKHAAINNGDALKPLYKIKSDPRVTRVGKIIRKTSIDELPQLYNVLKGDMSLVGPRPPLAYEAEKYEAWHLRRILEMKPGITGLWQVEGRSRTGFSDAVRLDVRYLQTWSLMLDFKILFKTVKEVLQCRGAV